MGRSGRGGRTVLGVGAGLLCLAVAGCSSGTGAPVTAGGSGDTSSGSSTAVEGSSGGSTRPAVLVAVRAGRPRSADDPRPGPGALVVLDPATGVVRRTLDPAGVGGDAVQVDRDGRNVYYDKAIGCRHQLWRVPVEGGSPTVVVDGGSRPALSADGTRLAYVIRGDGSGCEAVASPSEDAYSIVIRVLATGASTTYPLDPGHRSIPLVVEHLSWKADGSRLLVSVKPLQDNIDWALRVLDPAKDRYYRGASGGRSPAGVLVPPTGPGSVKAPAESLYFREGVFLPGGSLFVVHRCCAGDGGPDLGTPSELLQRVDPGTGAVQAQIAVGQVGKDHTGLDSDASGNWLLYLSGTDLMVSEGGARPTTLTGGYQAADW